MQAMTLNEAAQDLLNVIDTVNRNPMICFRDRAWHNLLSPQPSTLEEGIRILPPHSQFLKF